MNQKHFDEIKAREQAATPAPWKVGSESEERGYYGANVVVGEKDSNSYVVMYRPIYPKETEFNNQVLADMKFAAHARTDMPALIEQHEQDQRQLVELRKENQKNAAYAGGYQDICDKYGKSFRVLLDKAKELQTEGCTKDQQIATLKKAYELIVKFLVSTGFADYVLCDQIPDALHKKYQPKDDGNYDNEPCFQCVQEYFMQQAQTELSHAKATP